MRAVRVLGRSGSGKTTLIERLVPVLAGRGRVATVKSIHHDIEVDDVGTDTYRHRAAGAERAIGITPSLTFSVETRGKDEARSEPAALDRLLSGLEDEGYAYVLVEGFSAASLPAIVLEGGEVDDGDARVARVADPEAVDVHEIATRIDRLDPWTGSP